MEPLTLIINIIFSTGVFPEVLKNATIVPLYKQGENK